MAEPGSARVAILDYGVGNLFSVRHACSMVGLNATVTTDKAAILAADGVIVPGVGAFGAAMEALRRLDVLEPLKDLAESGTPLIGICLGMQLFMSESEEFGRHQGLGLFEGPVVRFGRPRGPTGPLKVPQVGWNRLLAPGPAPEDLPPGWAEWPLQGVIPGDFMYFVHSLYAKPEDPDVILTVSRYGDIEFCSSIKRGNVFACQFHPERSGPTGLKIYRNIARHITENITAGKKIRV